jgi:sigma-E factor negative regulatory protein RseC
MNRIKHEGIVDMLEKGHARIRITQVAACAGCAIANRCNASDSKVKLIDVYTDSRKLNVGQSVVVSTSGKTVSYALIIGFGIPLLLLISILITAKLCLFSDLASAALALASLILYYIIVYYFRNEIAQRFSFRIEE